MPAVTSNTGCYRFGLLYEQAFLLSCPKESNRIHLHVQLKYMNNN